MNTTENSIIEKLEAHICANCSPFDYEAAYLESLDSEGPVTVVGMQFYPSQIVKECGGEATVRCEANDYLDFLQKDGQVTSEIKGECYAMDEANEEKESFLDDLRNELSTLDDEKAELENEEEPDQQAIEAKQKEMDDKQAEIDECEAHSF